ncbi:MAG: DUF1439 domain-containing protein [Candidatus Competibacteraceae bacterium]|nr:DUF1439 domain-containing protein [Candidatus Competibacteraceae bacterium]
MKLLKKWATYGLFTLGNKALSIYAIELTTADMQRAIERHFPLRREKFFTELTLSDPVIHLQEEAQRIGVNFAAMARLPGNITIKWRGLVDGLLEYRRDIGSFYLLDLKLQGTDSQGIPVKAMPVQPLVEKLLQRALANTPIYQLDDQDLNQAIARLLVKSIHIKKDRLIVELGL